MWNDLQCHKLIMYVTDFILQSLHLMKNLVVLLIFWRTITHLFTFNYRGHSLSIWKKLQVERHLVNCGYNYTVWDGYVTGHRSTQFMDAISISCARLVISSTFSTEGGMIKFWYNIPINWSESVFPLLLCVKFWSIIFIKHNFHLSATSTWHLDCNQTIFF